MKLSYKYPFCLLPKENPSLIIMQLHPKLKYWYMNKYNSCKMNLWMELNMKYNRNIVAKVHISH